MKPNHRFLICEHCGNFISFIHDSESTPVCCGDEMKELVPNTVEAAVEKHVPVVTVSGDSITVQVGSTLHPMEEKHHIDFIYVETERGGQRKTLHVGEEPKLTFTFTDDKPVAVYAYCNLHGLWKTEVK